MQASVLLVDDEPNLLSGLQRALRKEPYEILTALGAEEGLAILASHPVDVVVSDYAMPGMKGTEFLAEVFKRHPTTIRFILTGHATLEMAIQAINKGAVSRFFLKPVSAFDLAHTIRHALEQKELLEQARSLLEASTKQSALLDRLEKQHPGITKVNRAEDGLVVLEDKITDAGGLAREIRKQVTKLRAGLEEGGSPIGAAPAAAAKQRP